MVENVWAQKLGSLGVKKWGLKASNLVEVYAYVNLPSGWLLNRTHRRNCFAFELFSCIPLAATACFTALGRCKL